MKRFFKRLLSKLPKRVVAGAVVGLAIALPIAAFAADTVNISATTGVANVTAGDTTYSPSVNASYDQIVKVQVAYTNDEAPSSGKVANNVRIKFTIPSTPGTNQTVTTNTTGDNTNSVDGSAMVVLNRADAYLQYIPGSAEANVTEPDGTIVHETAATDPNLANAVNGQGFLINNGNPCQSAAVAVEALVTIPGVNVTKQVRVLKDGATFVTSNTANPGDTLQYKIAYTNTGNTTESNVVIRDNLPPQLTLVPGTTYLVNDTNPNGLLDQSNAVTGGGLVVGTYEPGASAYVVFEVTVPAADQMQCGTTEFTNVGIAQPQGMSTYYNTAVTDVTKTCASTPAYACSAFDAVTGANRTVTVTKFATTQSGGATFKNVVLTWGDSSSALTTDATNIINQTHQYAADGTYTLTAVAHFNVNNQDVTANCTKTVSFNTPPTTPPVTPPTKLVNTGPGSVVGLFAGVTVAGAVLHRLFLSRRQARQ